MAQATSSVLRNVNYHRGRRRLLVTFKSGAVYEYTQVPPEEFTALMTAPSLGHYFTLRIRNQYPCEKVQETDAVRFQAAGIPGEE